MTLEQWLEIVDNNAPLPENLMGTLIAHGNVLDDGLHLSPANAGVFVVNLEDGSRQVLGPGTTDFDYGPRWSPDGLQLAFIRADDLNLYIVNADGSGKQRVTAGTEYELLIGWLPEGQTLAYVFPGPEGPQLRFLDLVTGVQRDGFVMDAKGANVAISPDGQRIAFAERMAGSMDYGLYIAQLDGSDRRLIAQLDRSPLSDPRWSPDGNWLLVGISSPDPRDSTSPSD